MFTEPRCQIIAVHTSLTILETICQLALRGVENFFAGRSKDHRQSHRCYTIISNSSVGLHPRWTSKYLIPWTGNESPVLHPLNANSCLKLSIFRYHSTHFVSYFLSLFGIEVDDPSASPTDTVPRIFHMVKLQQCYRFRAPVFFRYRRRWRPPDRLTSPLFWRELFSRYPFLFLWDHICPLIILQRKSGCCNWWKCAINNFQRYNWSFRD